MASRQCRSARRGLLVAGLVAVAGFIGLSARWGGDVSPNFVPTRVGTSPARQAVGRMDTALFVSKAGPGAALIRHTIQGAAQRRGCTATRAVGLFYSTQTGNTETAAGAIAEEAGLEVAAIDDIGAEDLAGYDGLIVGCPTWNTGADEYRSGTAWDDVIDEIKGLDLGGKPVAVFGCGDQEGYGDNFCDGIEELHATFAAAGAKMIGYTSADGYDHSESKSDQGGKFLGLPIDEDNQSDMTGDRVKAWVAQLKSEGMPL